jgi:lysophospholipase L1-like esterase
VVALDARFTRRRSFAVSTNSLGLRGPEPVLPAPGFRILCAGDSITFGWGLPVAEAYPTLLADELGVEVINGGMPAAAPPEIAAWAREWTGKLDADLLLFVKQPQAPGGGDAVGPYVEAVKTLAEAVSPVPVAVVLPPRSTFSARPEALAEAESQRVIEGLAPLPVLDLTPVFRQAQRREGVVGDFDEHHQRVLLLPDRKVLLEAPAPPAGLHPTVVRFFEDNHHAAEPLIYDGGHPDEQGTALMARELAAWIRDQGWLP